MTALKPKDSDKFPATKNINQNKNRSNDLLPLTVKRVCLPAKPGVDGSDYINATYLQVNNGAEYQRQFLVIFGDDAESKMTMVPWSLIWQVIFDFCSSTEEMILSCVDILGSDLEYKIWPPWSLVD